MASLKDTQYQLMTKGNYDHAAVESHWQSAWDEANTYRTPDDPADLTYVLGMYPYPSGKLHMGHVRNYTITDAYARYRRMRGDDVLHPMGWDAFGLPAENAAKERDTNPRDWTYDCIATMREQMESMGFGYDWNREITTCDPEYYQWNQYFFREFYDAGIVERRDADVNWCPSCETVLADEQVEGEAELCWRCDTAVEQRELAQWFLKITEWADELVDDIDRLEGWPNNVKQMQRNWIGRQYGTLFPFEIDGYGTIEAFTTRADTIYGATFFAVATDHPIADDLRTEHADIERFITDEADPDGDEPNGVPTGLTATNPVTGDEIPVYIADFVLSDVGTGALMGVPAHDDRDHAFATTMDIDITPVVAPESADTSDSTPTAPDISETAYTDDGVLINSGEYTGLDSETARTEITADTDGAELDTQYRLRDWGISRQRYWGTPIPVIYCEDCGPVLVPEEDLPVELPPFINTTGNPLEAATDWKETTCPECGAAATRETDTMDTFVDSSWYFLRYVSPDIETDPFDIERANQWMPVDQYVGGIEHAVMHLLYSRFFTKVLAENDNLAVTEPFENLLAQGMVQLDGEKMSKSKGNTVSPQRIVEEYGADTARLFMMQAAQPERDFDWSEEGVRSTNQLLTQLIELVDVIADAEIDRAGIEQTDATAQSSLTHTETALTDDRTPIASHIDNEIDAAVAIATQEYDELSFSVALREARDLVQTLRQYRNYTTPHADTYRRGLETVIRLLAPVAPHLTEELYSALDHDEFITNASWPQTDVDRDIVTKRRTLVEDTREDVRQIITVADIDDPEAITIVVSPAWKYTALTTAIESDADNLISALMQNPTIREQGDAAAEYGQQLQNEREALARTLPPEREYETLRAATWLIEREFDAPVTVVHADDAPADVARQAEPGRPAIDIDE